MKEDLQIKLHQEEQLVKTQLLHKQTVQRLELKRRKLLLLHVLEQNLFEDVRIPPSLSLLISSSSSIEMHEIDGCHRSTPCSLKTTSRTNERIRIKTISQSS